MWWQGIWQQWMPHRLCFNSDPVVVLLIVLGEGLTAFAYFVISAQLIQHVRANWRMIAAVQGWRTIGLYGWFAAFILSCGIGHVWSIVLLWQGVYYAAAIWTMWTGIVSLITVDRLQRANTQAVVRWNTPAMQAAMVELVGKVTEFTGELVEQARRRDAGAER